MTPIKKTEDEAEWTKKTAQIRQRIAELSLDEDYESEVIYVALIKYLHQNLGQELRDEFLESAKKQPGDT